QRLVDPELDLVEALRRIGHVPGRIGGLAAPRRDVPVVVVIARPEVQRELARDGPAVLHVAADRAKRRVREHRSVEHGDLIGHAAPENQWGWRLRDRWSGSSPPRRWNSPRSCRSAYRISDSPSRHRPRPARTGPAARTHGTPAARWSCSRPHRGWLGPRAPAASGRYTRSGSW